nr:unnamed protein product [Digitaria exilis]
MAEEDEADHINKLPDDVLVGILSLLPYKNAVQTSSVSRRWEPLLAQLPSLMFSMSEMGTHSEPRVQSMERTLRRRCRRHDVAVQTLNLTFRKDDAMECRYAGEFIALANAQKLLVQVSCDRALTDAGDWSLELPPATTELLLLPHWYAVRQPRIHGASVDTLRSLTLDGLTVLGQEFLHTPMPSLEDLYIGNCTLPVSIEITSDAMPRLMHLDIVDVSVMTRGTTKAGISVLAGGELRTLRMSGRRCSSLEPPSDTEWFLLPASFSASFTSYSCFRLRAPRLRVFEWRCCYADEVHIESVGLLSDVAVEIATGRMPRTWQEESEFVSVEHRDKLMSDILLGLMPGLRPRSWQNW